MCSIGQDWGVIFQIGTTCDGVVFTRYATFEENTRWTAGFEIKQPCALILVEARAAFSVTYIRSLSFWNLGPPDAQARRVGPDTYIRAPTSSMLSVCYASLEPACPQRRSFFTGS